MTIPTHKRDTKSFTSWDDGTPGSKTKALAVYNQAIAGGAQIVKMASASSAYRNVLPDISIRDGFTRADYEVYRPEEATQKQFREMFKQTNCVYKQIGIIHNVIDLMSDFACQGIEIMHPSTTTQKIINEWAKKVNFRDRSERFLNILYRLGNVIVTRATAKLKAKELEKLRQGLATADLSVEIPPAPEKNEIPWRYTFRNPMTIDILGDDLSVFVGNPFYALRVPANILKRIRNPENQIDKKLVSKLPQDIYNLIKSGLTSIPLDPDKTSVYFYKKDDWEFWAEPMVNSIMSDLIMLNKMKLADISALDSAISHVRIWKLGNLDAKIPPTRAGMEKLASMLTNITSGGAIDLIWGPDLEIDETSTEVYKFLGDAKYGPVMNAIYAGLGIPPTLTGSATSSGFTNNFISLKTLVERLEYGRAILTNFWETELKLLQQALGFRGDPYIKFNRMNLSDEAAEKALMVQLADRNLVSVETVQERFGEIPEIELIRLKREHKQRANPKIPNKIGPYEDIMDTHAKTALSSGVVAPSQVGLNLPDKKPGEKTALEFKQAEKKKNKGVVGQGRPKTSKDKKKRKTKRVLPRSKASQFSQAFIFAKETQKTISDHLTPIYLESLGKKNMRMLSDKEAEQFENLKFALLFSAKLNDNINGEKIEQMVCNKLEVPKLVEELCKTSIEQFKEKFNREPTLDDIRQNQALVYALYNGDYDNGEVLD